MWERKLQADKKIMIDNSDSPSVTVHRGEMCCDDVAVL